MSTATTSRETLTGSQAVAHRKVSYEEFLETSDEDTCAEWVDGEVIPMSPVSTMHQDVAVFLLSLLRHFAEAHELGKVLCEPLQMKTGPDLPGRAPDIIFVSQERLSQLGKTHLEGPADLVVEIISPESRGRDRGDKFYEYEQGGVREYWLVDPQRAQAEFYTLGEDGIFRPIPPERGVFRSVVLDGLWLKTDWLWQSPLPKVLDVLKEWQLV